MNENDIELNETTELLQIYRKKQLKHNQIKQQQEQQIKINSKIFYFSSFLTILIFILFIIFARSILSNSSTSSTTSSSSSSSTTSSPPSSSSSDSNLNFEGLSNGNTLNSVPHPLTPTSYWGAIKKPYPTGSFWTNFVIDNGDGAVAVLPYGIKCLDSGVQISYGPTRRTVTNKWIRDTFDVDLQISTIQPYANRGILSYDELSVTMNYDVSGGSYKAYFIKGSPFITILFQSSTPIITSTTMHITKMEQHPIPTSSTSTSIPGLVYIVTLGNYQKWIIYSSDSTTALLWNGDSITASSPSHGFIRMGILPTSNSVNNIDTLLSYLPTYPTGVDIDIQYNTQGKQTISTLQYKFKFQNANTGTTNSNSNNNNNNINNNNNNNINNNNQLLMLALPHHMDILTNSNKNDAIHLKLRDIYSPIWTIKGKMHCIVGYIWTLQYTLLNPGWVYDLEGRIIPTVNLNAIGQALQLDVLSIPPAAQTPYSFGKECSRMATLALIADNLGIADARQKSISNLENSLTSWLVQSNTDSLIYDSTYGGIIPSLGILDKYSDYGSGWYSDHHFHYAL